MSIRIRFVWSQARASRPCLRPRPNNPGEVGFFIRSSSGLIRRNGDLEIGQRAGLIKFDDVFLVLTMLRIDGDEEELFDIWWNYYARGGLDHFRRMSEQEEITIHFYNEEAQAFSVNRENGFRKFFGSVPDVIKKSTHWTDIEFDRAVRGFSRAILSKGESVGHDQISAGRSGK